MFIFVVTALCTSVSNRCRIPPVYNYDSGLAMIMNITMIMTITTNITDYNYDYVGDCDYDYAMNTILRLELR